MSREARSGRVTIGLGLGRGQDGQAGPADAHGGHAGDDGGDRHALAGAQALRAGERGPGQREQEAEHDRQQQRVEDLDIDGEPDERVAGEHGAGANRDAAEVEAVEERGAANVVIETALGADGFRDGPGGRERDDDRGEQGGAGDAERERESAGEAPEIGADRGGELADRFQRAAAVAVSVAAVTISTATITIWVSSAPSAVSRRARRMWRT